jgi:hypothetical protein
MSHDVERQGHQLIQSLTRLDFSQPSFGRFTALKAEGLDADTN